MLKINCCYFKKVLVYNVWISLKWFFKYFDMEYLMFMRLMIKKIIDGFVCCIINWLYVN